MTQVFNTTQEARQWMMAHPMREVSSKDEDYTCIYRWNLSEFTFEYLNLKNKWEPASVDYCLHSFAVIDPEPTPNDWEEVPIYPEGMDDTGWELLEKERLKYILTHASKDSPCSRIDARPGIPLALRRYLKSLNDLKY